MSTILILNISMNLAGKDITDVLNKKSILDVFMTILKSMYVIMA